MVNVIFPTPALYRWFRSMAIPGVVIDHARGMEVLDEARYLPILAAAEGKELSAELRLADRGRGTVFLSMHQGKVIGATGSEPERFMGLTEDAARRIAMGRLV